MQRKMMVLVLMAAIGVLAAVAGATPVYLVSFDQEAQSPGPNPYVAGAGEILPAGVTGTLLANTNLADSAAGAFQGGQAQSQTLGGKWPNVQGYSFGGANPPLIENSYTIEFLVNPDFSGCSFGLTSTSTLINSYQGTIKGDLRIYVDQSTGLINYDPKINRTIGSITSTTALQTGQWYHIAVVARATGGAGQQTELWINGELDATGVYPLGWETQGQFGFDDFNIGSSRVTNQRNWQGQIDAFAIDDTALAPGSFNLVPEPATLALVLSGMGMCLSRRRRKS